MPGCSPSPRSSTPRKRAEADTAVTRDRLTVSGGASGEHLDNAGAAAGETLASAQGHRARLECLASFQLPGRHPAAGERHSPEEGRSHDDHARLPPFSETERKSLAGIALDSIARERQSGLEPTC
eukprot:scaffold7625_cov277-Pinguiococcus_pyrenoidosus.AAC.8